MESYVDMRINSSSMDSKRGLVWKLQFSCLDNGCITFFDSQDKHKSFGVFPIDALTTVTTTSSSSSSSCSTVSSLDEHFLTLKNSDHTMLEFMLYSVELRELWSEAVVKHIALIKRASKNKRVTLQVGGFNHSPSIIRIATRAATTGTMHASIEGYVTIKGPWPFLRWKVRWLSFEILLPSSAMDDNRQVAVLRFYKNRSKAKLKGSFMLSRQATVSKEPLDKGMNRHIVRVDSGSGSGSRLLLFSCDSFETREAWLGGISAAIEDTRSSSKGDTAVMVPPVHASIEKDDEAVPAPIEKDDEAVPASIEKDDEAVSASIEKDDEAVPVSTEKDDEAVPASVEKDDEAVSASIEKDDEAVSASIEKDDEAVPVSTEKDDEAVPASVEKDDEAVPASIEKDDEAVRAPTEKDDVAVPEAVIDDQGDEDEASVDRMNGGDERSSSAVAEQAEEEKRRALKDQRDAAELHRFSIHEEMVAEIQLLQKLREDDADILQSGSTDLLSPHPPEGEEEETDVVSVIASSHSVTGRPPAESFLPVEQSISSPSSSGGVQQLEDDGVVAMDLSTTPLGSVRLHKLKIEEQQRHQQRVKAEASRLKKKLGD